MPDHFGDVLRASHGPTNAIYDTCTAAEHREAADTAVPLVDGLQVWGADFLYQ